MKRCRTSRLEGAKSSGARMALTNPALLPSLFTPEKKTLFWIVENSWGPEWREQVRGGQWLAGLCARMQLALGWGALGAHHKGPPLLCADWEWVWDGSVGNWLYRACSSLQVAARWNGVYWGLIIKVPLARCRLWLGCVVGWLYLCSVQTGIEHIRRLILPTYVRTVGSGRGEGYLPSP